MYSKVKSIRITAESIQDRLNHYKQANVFNITFCGMFTTGKSSLVNSLLDNIISLPTGINSTTMMITRIYYAPATECKLQIGKKSYDITESQMQRILNDDFSCIDIRRPKSAEIHIGINLPLLKDGVVLVDTPGFNDDVSGEIDQLTINEIQHTDFCIICTNAIYAFNDKAKILLKDVQQLTDGNFVTVLNCINMIRQQEQYDDIIDEANLQLRNFGNNIIGKGKFFPVCSAPSEIEFNGFDVFLEQILYSRNDIRISTNTAYMYKKLSVFTQKTRDCKQLMMNSKAEITDKHNSKLNSSVLIKKASSQREIEKLNLIQNDILVMLFDKYYETVCEKIDELSRYNFISECNKYITIELSNKFSLYVYSKTKDIESFNYQSWSKALKRIVSNFNVSAPVARQVERQGLFNQIWNGAYYTAYNDFRKVAKSQIKKSLIPTIEKKLRSYVRSAILDLKSLQNMTSGYEDQLSSLDIQIDKLIKLESLSRCLNSDIESIINKGLESKYRSANSNLNKCIITVDEILRI